MRKSLLLTVFSVSCLFTLAQDGSIKDMKAQSEKR